MILTATTDIGGNPIFDSAIISPLIAIKRFDSRSEPFLIVSIDPSQGCLNGALKPVALS
jgi:hypothetical protein